MKDHPEVLSLHQGLLLNLPGNSALWVMCTWQVVKRSFSFQFSLSCVHTSHRKTQSWRWGMGVTVIRMRDKPYWAKAEFGPFCIILAILPSHYLTSIFNMFLSGCKLGSIYLWELCWERPLLDWRQHWECQWQKWEPQQVLAALFEPRIEIGLKPHLFLEFLVVDL